MSRLTYKNYIEEWECKFEKNSDTQWSIAESDTHIKITGNPIDKLAKFEDFMENFELENVGQLKMWAEWFTFLQRVMKENSIKNIADLQSYFKENNDLKTMWNELKEEVYNMCEFYDDLVECNDATEYVKGKNLIIKEIYNKIKELEKL